MKTVNVNMPIEAVAEMLTNKMKSDKEFGVFVTNVLEDQYRLELVLNIMQNGFPKPKFTPGTKVYVDFNHYDYSDKKEYPITEGVFEEYLHYNAYSPYKIKYIYQDKEHSVTLAEDKVSLTPFKEVEKATIE